MKIEVYTDGSATTNDKPGGYGYVIVINGVKKVECSGHMTHASNNDAEMEAAIQGLAAVYKMGMEGEPFPIETECFLVSDSQLILGWASGQYKFKQQDKLDKYRALKALVDKLRAKTRWVRGHAGDEHNERCDKLANEARLSVQNKKLKEEAKEKGHTLIGTKKTGVICVWYKNSLKVIDLETNIVENYDRTVHGARGSMYEIREERSR